MSANCCKCGRVANCFRRSKPRMDFADANRAMIQAHHSRLGRRNPVPRSIVSLHKSCDTRHPSRLVRRPPRRRIGRVERCSFGHAEMIGALVDPPGHDQQHPRIRGSRRRSCRPRSAGRAHLLDRSLAQNAPEEGNRSHLPHDAWHIVPVPSRGGVQ